MKKYYMIAFLLCLVSIIVNVMMIIDNPESTLIIIIGSIMMVVLSICLVLNSLALVNESINRK